MILGQGSEDQDLAPATESGTTRQREVELKLELEPNGAAALVEHPLVRETLGDPKHSESVYYDTRKHALRDAGVSLRVRRTGDDFVQTVKSDARPAAGLFDRSEWEVRIGGPDPEPDRAALADPVLQALAVRRGLQPTFATHIERRACTLTRNGARIELVLDKGEVVAGELREPLSEIELELIEGSPSDLFDLAREFQIDIPLRLGVLTKSERGTRLAAGKTSRAMKAEPVRLAPSMLAEEAFRAISLSCLRHFRVNEPLVIAMRDVDGLHQSRVALRRLRSAFSLFRRVKKGAPFDYFRAELRALALTLGTARNIDVLMRRRGDQLTKASRRALVAERERAYDDAILVLQSPHTRSLMLDLAEWLLVSDENRALPVTDFSSAVLDRFWRKVKRPARKLGRLDEEARHELRIAGKKLRYAGEFFAGLYAGEAQRSDRDDFLGALTALQDNLGDLNDLATERALETELATRGIVLPRASRAADSRARAELIAGAEQAFVRLDDAGPFWH